MRPELIGFDELERLIEELSKVPQQVATRSARAGSNIELRQARALAPDRTGKLKLAMKLIGEKSKKGQSKKVYQITFDRAYNGDGEDGLVKISKKTGKRAYYPTSQDQGWKYPNGGYHIGEQFMKNSAREESDRVKQKMIDVANDEIKKVLNKAR